MDFTFSDDFLSLFQLRQSHEVRENDVPNSTQTDDQLNSNKKTTVVKIENHDVPVEEGLVYSIKLDSIESIPPIFVQTAEMKTTKHDLKKLSEVTTLSDVPNENDDQLNSNKKTNLVKIENHDVPVEEGLVNSEKLDNIKSIPPIFAQTAEMTTTKHDLKILSEVTTLPSHSKNESNTIANNKLYSNSSSSSQTLVKKCRKSTRQSLSIEIPKVESQVEPNLESTDNQVDTLNNLMSKEECKQYFELKNVFLEKDSYILFEGHSTENDNFPTLYDPYFTENGAFLNENGAFLNENGAFLNENGATLTKMNIPSTFMAPLTTGKSTENKFVVHEIHLNRQDNIHAKEKRFTCGLCKILFLQCSWYLDHSETIHKHCHLCAVCGDEFVEGDLLWQHHKDIHGEKHFACNICGLLTNKQRLKRHEKLHHVKQNYLVKKEVISFQDTANIDTKEDISNNIDHMKNEKMGRSSNLPPIDSHRVLSSKNKSLIATEDEKPTNAENIFVTSAVKMEFNDEIVQNEINRTTRDDCKFLAENNVSNALLQDKKRKSSKKISGKQDLYCAVCDKTFSRVCTWDFHMKCHSKEEPHSSKSETNYQCSYCHKVFLHPSQLKEHIRTHTGERPFQCSFCEKSFTQKSVLVKHERTHTGEKPYTCESCGESFIQSSLLQRHSKRFCKKKFESADLLKNRKKDVSDDGQQAKYQCSYCNKLFPNLSNLKRHEQSHTGERPFPCDICGLRLSQKTKLKRHLLVKHKINNPLKQSIPTDKRTQIDTEKHINEALDVKIEQSYKSGCVNDEIDQANLTFPVPPSKLEPSKENHSIITIFRKKYRLWIQDNIKEYQCISCKQQFQDVTLLQGHYCGDSDKKRFRCSFCGKSVSRKPDLENHIRTHTGEKPFRCEVCGISYSHINKLKQHERTSHVSSRCNICKKKFVTKYLLKEHKLNEHKGNQFVCKICGKEFKMISRLKNHEQIHNVKNLFCDICGMKFTTNDLLQNHLTKHTEEKSLDNCYEEENSSETEVSIPSEKPEQILDAEINSESIRGKRNLKSQPKYNIPKHKMKKYEYFNR